jgi:hypothetical protein
MNQYNQYTTETAKYLGRLAGLSPMKIDYFIKAQFGKVPDMLVRNVEKIAFDKKDKSRSQIFLQEEQYVLAGRNYNNFYENKKYWQQLFNDIGISKRNTKENPLSEEEIETYQNHKMFEATNEIIKDLSEKANSGIEIPDYLKHSAFELLKELNDADKPYLKTAEYINLTENYLRAFPPKQ